MLTRDGHGLHLSRAASLFARRCILLLLTLSLLIAPLAAQTDQVTTRAHAERLLDEGLQLRNEGSKESLQQAIQKYAEAQPLFHALNDGSNEALTLLARGSLFDALGEKQKALDHYNQALPLFRAVGDRNGEAATLSSIGSVYNALSEKQKALDHYNQALLLSRAVGDRRGEAVSLHNIGSVYDSLGEKQKALDHYNQALLITHAVGDRHGEATTLNNIGLVYSALGETQKALDSYNQALLLNHAVGDRHGEAVSLNNIGSIYNALGKRQKALDSHNKALLLVRAVGDRHWEAVSLNNIGSVYNALGEKQKALDYYDQALPLFRAVGDRRGEAVLLNDIGSVYSALREHQRALDYYNQALPILRAVGGRSEEVTTLGNIVYSERDLGKLNDALAHIKAATDILESLRTNIGSQELRSSFFATAQSYYEFYIDLLMRLHMQQPGAGYDGKALHASERARARSLLELLTEAGADIRQGVDPQLVERERALQQQLNASAQRQIQLLSGPHTDAQAAASGNEIENLRTELQQVETQIRQTSPRYAALTQPQPLTLAEIQTQALDADTLLLEYALGKDRSYLWLVTTTAIKSYELPKRTEIEAAAREFYLSVSQSPQASANDVTAKREIGSTLRQQAQARSEQAAARLSRMLLAPAATLLGKKRLLIVADGALQFVPFAALPELSSEGGGAKPPLIVEHEIVSLPSASTLAVLKRKAGEHKATTKTLAVLADPVFERADERFKTHASQPDAHINMLNTLEDKSRDLGVIAEKSARESGLAEMDLRIPRLPATRREADAISALAPPHARLKVLDFAANRGAATDPALADYRFVHFATHGFINSQHPELSGIMFSMFNEQGQAQDGFLRTHEVFNLKLNADVVVLSACQTGLGKEVKGEGLVGLTRGFMYAGVPRVVVSLWSVNDEVTAELMTRFYKGMLTDKLRPAQALQAAQASMLREPRYSAPFYWAAFTLQGEWR